MQIRKFVAPTMSEAVSKVKKELGDDAVILSTREFRPGNERTKKFTRQLTEITAAIDYDFPTPNYGFKAYEQKGKPLQKKSSSLATKMNEILEQQSAEKATVPTPEIETKADDPIAALKIELNRLREETEALKQHKAEEKLVAPKPLKTEADKNEMPEINSIVDLPATAQDYYLSLTKQGISQDILDSLFSDLRREIFVGNEDLFENKSDTKKWFQKQLKSFVNCEPHQEETPGDEPPFLCALVGPTGVGKTTTLAKLAARRLMNGQRVGFITIDTFRIAAAEQLATYANILQVPIEVAHSKSEFKAALIKMQDLDCIFIDTAGHSPKKLDTLQNQLEILGEFDIHTSLVLSLTARESVLNDAQYSYQSFNFRDIIFTKLDETDEFGSVINIATQCQKPVAFLTMGQKVPEDINPAISNNIIDLCLN